MSKNFIEDNKPKFWVDLAVKEAMKNVRLPKCVRNGSVKNN